MKKKLFVIIIAVLIGSFALYGQSITFKLGGTMPTMDSDLWEVNMENLAFGKQDMRGTYVGAEFEMYLGKTFSFSLEAGNYSKTVFTLYRDFVFEDGSAIEQDIALNLSNFEAGFKFYPLGHRGTFNPFIGGGAGLYSWKYVQGGDFVDFEEETVSEGEAVTKTLTPGFNVKAGFVYRFKRSVGLSMEVRYHYVKGELSSLFEGFEKFDLSGLTVNVGLNLFLR